MGQYPNDPSTNHDNNNIQTPPREYSFRSNAFMNSPQTTHSKRSTGTSKTDPDTSLESGTLSPGRILDYEPEEEHHFARDDKWMIAHQRAEEQQEDLRQVQEQRRPITPKVRRVGLKKVNNTDILQASRRPLAASIDRDDSSGKHTVFPATSPKRSPPRLDFGLEMSEPGPVIPHTRMVDDEPKNKQPLSRNSPIGPLEFRVSPKKDAKKPSPSRPRGPQAVALHSRNSSALEQGIGLFLGPMKNLVQCNDPDYTSVAEYSLTEPVPLEKTNSTISGASTEVATNRATDQAKKRIQALEDQFMSQKMMEIQQRENAYQTKMIQRKMHDLDNESLPTDEEIDIKQSLRRYRHHKMAQQQTSEQTQEEQQPKAAPLVVHQPPPVRNHRYSFGATKIPAKMMEQESILSMSEDESSRMTQSTAHSQQALLSTASAAKKNVPIPTTIQPKRKKKRQVDLVPVNSDQQQFPSEMSSLPDQSLSSSVGVEVDGSRSSIRNGVNSIMSGLPKEPLQPLIEQQESPRSMPRTPPRKKDDSPTGLLMPKLFSGSKDHSVFKQGASSSEANTNALQDGDAGESATTRDRVVTPENTGRASPRITQTRPVTGGSYLSPPRTSGRIPQVGEFSPDPVFCSKSVTSADMHSYYTQSPSASTLDRNFSMSFDSSIRSKVSQSLDVVPEDGTAALQSPLSRMKGRNLRSPQNSSPPKDSSEEILGQASTTEIPEQPRKQIEAKLPPPPPPPLPLVKQNGPFQFLPPPQQGQRPTRKWQKPVVPLPPEPQAGSRAGENNEAVESLYKSTPAWAVMNQMKKDRESTSKACQSQVNRAPKARNMQGSLEAENDSKSKSSVMKAISIFEKQMSGGNGSQPSRSNIPVGRIAQSKPAPRPHDDIFDDLDTGDEASVSVKSLLSAFEAAPPSGDDLPGEYEDDDDDTASVKSLRDKFEGPAEAEESEVSKMKAMFEVKQKSGKPFQSGTNELQDVFSKFQAKISSKGQKLQKVPGGQSARKSPEAQIELISPDNKQKGRNNEGQTPSTLNSSTVQNLAPNTSSHPNAAGHLNHVSVVETRKVDSVRVSVADRAKMFGSVARQKSNSGPLATKAITNATSKSFGSRNRFGKAGPNTVAGNPHEEWLKKNQRSDSGAQFSIPKSGFQRQSQVEQSKVPFPSPPRGITEDESGKRLESSPFRGQSGPSQMNASHFNRSPKHETLPETSLMNEKNPSNHHRLALAAKSSKFTSVPSLGARAPSVKMVANSFNKSFVPQQATASQNHEPSQFHAQPMVRHGVVLKPVANRTLRCSTSSLQAAHLNNTSTSDYASRALAPSAKDTPLISVEQLPVVSTQQNSFNKPMYVRPNNLKTTTGPYSYRNSSSAVVGIQEIPCPSPESVPTANPLIVSEHDSPNAKRNVVLLRNSVSVGKPMKTSHDGAEAKQSPESLGSITGSDYSEGVTLDLSIAEVSGLTMPTALSPKQYDGSITLSPFSNGDSTATSLKSMSSKADRVPLMQRKAKASDESTVGGSINGIGESSRKSESSAFADYVPLIEDEVKASDDITTIEEGVATDEQKMGEMLQGGRNEGSTKNDMYANITHEAVTRQSTSYGMEAPSRGEELFQERNHATNSEEQGQASVPEKAERIEERNSETLKARIDSHFDDKDDGSSQGESFFGRRARLVADREGKESQREPDELKDDSTSSVGDNDSASTGLWNPTKIEKSFPPRKSASPEIFKFDSDWGSFNSNTSFTPIQDDQEEVNKQAFSESASTPPRPSPKQSIVVQEATTPVKQFTRRDPPRESATTPTRSLPRENTLPEARTPTNQIRKYVGASKSPARTPREDTPVDGVLSPSSVKTPVARTPRSGNLSSEAKTPTTSNKARPGFSQSVPQFRPMPIRTNLGSFVPYSAEERSAPKASAAASLYSRHQAAARSTEKAQPALPSNQTRDSEADEGPQFLVTRSTVTGDPRMMISPVRTPERQPVAALEAQHPGEAPPPSLPTEPDASATTGLAPRIAALSPARSPPVQDFSRRVSIPAIPAHSQVAEPNRLPSNPGFPDTQSANQPNNHAVVANPSPSSSPTSFYHNSSAMAARLRSIKAARLRRAAQRYHQASR